MNYFLYPGQAIDMMNDKLREALETRSLRRIKSGSYRNPSDATGGAARPLVDGTTKGPQPGNKVGSIFMAAIYW